MDTQKVLKLTVTLIVAVLVMAFVAVVPTRAELIGLSSDTPGSLYAINPTTGAATLITNLTGDHNTSLVGLDFMGGTLYATDVYVGGEYKFGSIDMSTGAFTVINNQGGSANWHGLAGNEVAGLLYSIDINDGNKLKSVTPVGVITTIGSGNNGVDGRGMAYDSINGILYATGGGGGIGSLYTVDTSTGVATLIGSMGISTNLFGLAYDPFAGILYGNSGDLFNLYTINLTTGLATLVGSNGVRVRIDGLAFLESSPVPEPSTMILLGSGLIGLWGFRRKFRK